MAVLQDTDFLLMGVYLFIFMFLFLVGLKERFAMIGAALVSGFIAIEIWELTASLILPAIFVFVSAICIGITITTRD